MMKSTIAGVVFILLHLLHHCSATNVTTMVLNGETPTSGTITPSTSEHITMRSNTTLTASEYSDGYIQSGNPQVSTTGMSVTTITASVERSEQVASASPTTEQPRVESMQKTDNNTNVEQNISSSTENPSSIYPIQKDTNLSNKSTDELVSSSKVNIKDSGDELDESDVDTDDRGSIAETEVSDPYKTEALSTATEEDKIENEAATPLPEDLPRAGVKMGDADVRDDAEDDYENVFETSSKSDNDTERNGTSVVTPMYMDNTTNLNLHDTDGIEVQVLAEDMMDPDAQDDSIPISDDAVTNSSAEDIPLPQNETPHSANTNSASGTSGMDNISTSPTTYTSELNTTDAKTDISASDPEPVQYLPSFEEPIVDFGNENNPNAQQQTNSNGAEGVPSDSDKLANTTQEYHTASHVSESLDGFEHVHVLADDISLNYPEDPSINDNSESDQKPIEQTSDDRKSSTGTTLSESDGITSECHSAPCQPLNNASDINDKTGSFPQYTSNDQESISNLQNTSVGTPPGNDPQPVKANENNSSALDATVQDTPVGRPVNDSVDTNIPRNVPDESLSESKPETERNNVGSSMDGASPPIPGPDSQIPEVVEDTPPTLDETQTPQANYSTQIAQSEMTNVKDTTTNGQILKKMYTVPMGSVLQIHLKMGENQEVTAVSKAPQIPQEQSSTPDNEGVERFNNEPYHQDYAKELVEVLADDITFGEDEKDTDKDSRSMEENSKDSYITTTTFKPYFVSDSHETTSPSAKCPFSAKTLDTKVSKDEQQRTVQHRPEGTIVEDPYYYEVDPFCLTRHHVLIPAVPVILPQWCFVPDTPDFMCPRYDLGFHIAFAHETQRDMYYRCVYGQAVLLKCPNLHYWDDERKICMLMTDFNHYQRHYHPSRNLYDQAPHHHCQHCRRNFLLPQDLDPTAQCSDRVLLACNTDGTLSVYECPGFYYYDRQIQLRWYPDVERCDYPADGDGPWR